MTDYFGFTMASLNENGSVFANPCKGDKNLSTLMYRPFSSWANNSEVSAIIFDLHPFVVLYAHLDAMLMKILLRYMYARKVNIISFANLVVYEI